MSAAESAGAIRSDVVAAMHRLEETGLNCGTAGNASVRLAADSFLVTPSGVKPRGLTADAIVEMSLAGTPLQAGARPSSEWRFHRDIYLSRGEVEAIVHVHSPHATALACRRLPIPQFHYMVAVAGGTDVRCADYARFGTQALSDHALSALAGRQACLLANHGMITLGATLTAAIDLALEVELLAQQYLLSLAGGTPQLLSDSEMEEALAAFAEYRDRHE
ncbi:MAG: class II aldolase/adducin family protein [Gammaproteobacteria bacterium]